MYLRDMSSGNFAPSFEEFFGTAAGLSVQSCDWRQRPECGASLPCPW